MPTDGSTRPDMAAMAIIRAVSHPARDGLRARLPSHVKVNWQPVVRSAP
jgi:hypothetical protein